MSPPKFSGPPSSTLAQFIKTMDSIPPNYATAFNSISADSVSIMTNKSYLHVWETDSDIDSLIQLTQVIIKIRHMYTLAPGPKSIPAAMVIIVEEERGRDHFARVCEVVKALVGKEGRPHLHGTLISFDGVRVVRGFDNATTPDAHGAYPPPAARAMKCTVDRINKTLQRVLTCGAFPTTETRKIIWHHGPVIHSLNFWINNTTAELRGALSAVSIASALCFTAPGGIKPHLASHNRNSVHDFERLESYLTRLGIFATLADPQSQFIDYTHLNTYMYFYAFYLSAFLPGGLARPHWNAALDALVTYCFRLRNAAAGGRPGADVVKLVQKHLSHSVAKAWARKCVDPESYANKAVCQAMAADDEIHTAVQLADAPFSTFKAVDFPVDPVLHNKKSRDGNGKKEDMEKVGLTAFARLTFGPAADLLAEHYVCAPVFLSFTPKPPSNNPNDPHITISPCHPSPFRIWLPKPAQDVETVTQRIRGIMIGVLELVRKGNPSASSPAITAEQRAEWAEVVKACAYALEGCKGKLPEGVEEKVKFVGEKMESGTWVFALAYEDAIKGKGGAGGVGAMGGQSGGGGGGGMGGFGNVGNGQNGGGGAFGPSVQPGAQPAGGMLQNGYGVPNGAGFGNPQGQPNTGGWTWGANGGNWG